MVAAAGLEALADHLAAKRPILLQAWRKAVEEDPELKTASTLSRSQFNDHIPSVLDAYEEVLRARRRDQHAEARSDEKQSAADHGLHRWHHGYALREVMREWGHLHLLLIDELDAWAQTHADLDPAVMPIARRELAKLCNDGVTESAGRYARMQQIEAAGRVHDLEQALDDLREVERQRAENWREAAHDLRGNVGVVQNVSAVLREPSVSEAQRRDFGARLHQGLDTLRALLDDLVSLSRLEAGHEQRIVKPFDAGALLSELCASSQPLAKIRGLFLTTDGPEHLEVEGDSVKTRRIAQNLLLNGLKYTERGGVHVKWEAGERWTLSIADTGPGFAGGAAPLARALKRSTEEAQDVETGGAAEAQVLPSHPHRSAEAKPGEGIGLSIVKRLCELLDASLELETSPGSGTTFRVCFPIRYPS